MTVTGTAASRFVISRKCALSRKRCHETSAINAPTTTNAITTPRFETGRGVGPLLLRGAGGASPNLVGEFDECSWSYLLEFCSFISVLVHCRLRLGLRLCIGGG